MNILIVNDTKIPAIKYGGTERAIWSLGKALVELGHEVSYLVGKGSACPFAKRVLFYDSNKSFDIQVPEDIDIVHFFWKPSDAAIKKPYIVTLQGNIYHPCKLDANTVFVSGNQAKRFGGSEFVYNGIDWNEYPKCDMALKRSEWFHFLADASWKVKNVRGAIRIARKAKIQLQVLGGSRLNFNMGFRFTPYLNIKFRGQVDNEKKAFYANRSNGLLFPVLWHEPFGIAITESLFYGCPVFGTPYGSLTELVLPEVGVVSNSESALVNALKNAGSFNKATCHEYAADKFNSVVMAKSYLKLYEKVLNGNTIHLQQPEIKAETIQQKKYLDMLP